MVVSWDWTSLAVGLLLGILAGGAAGAWFGRRRRSADHRKDLEEETKCLQAALDPVLREFADFERLLGEVRSQGATDSALLRQRLSDDLQRVGDLVLRVDADARGLKAALQGNVNLRGQWGEAVLEQILRNSGMLPGVHYDRQFSLAADARNAAGERRRPDAIVRLPGGGAVVIDSKTLFPDYLRAVEAETPEARREALRAHVQAFRGTVRDLASRHYETRVDGSVEFVLMFLPVEAAYQAAVSEDPSVLAEAMERNVLPVGPSGLILMLTLIRRIWRRDEERRNTAEILSAARTLAERTRSFDRDLESVGAALAKALAAYESAVKRIQSTDPHAQSVANALRDLRKLQGADSV